MPYTPEAKQTSSWSQEVEPGQAHDYNEVGVTYNQSGVTYNALKPSTDWTPDTKN